MCQKDRFKDPVSVSNESPTQPSYSKTNTGDKARLSKLAEEYA